MLFILAEEATSIVSMKPAIGLISQIIMWLGLIIVLAMFKGFIVQGVSIALAEILWKCADQDTREKIARWLGDKNIIIAQLKEIDKKLRKD